MHILATDESIALRRLVPDDMAAFWAYHRDQEICRFQSRVETKDWTAQGFFNVAEAAPMSVSSVYRQIGPSLDSGPTLIGDIGLFLNRDSSAAKIVLALAHPA